MLELEDGKFVGSSGWLLGKAYLWVVWLDFQTEFL